MNTNFFTDSVENRGASIPHTLENWGNSWLNPLASYAGGRRFEIIDKANLWDQDSSDDEDFYKEKTMKMTAFRIIFLVPGFLIGSFFKGLAFLSSEVRNRNANIKVHNTDKSEIAEKNVFNETIRRVVNRNEIIEKLNSLKEEDIKTLEEAVENGDWNNEIFNDENVSYLALKLLKDCKITQHQFGTIQIFWQAKLHYGKNLDFQHINSMISQSLISETFKANIDESEQKYPQESICGFYNEMKKLPKSEQFLCIIEKEHLLSSEKVNDTVSDAISENGVNELVSTEKYRLFPTIGMMQTFLDTCSIGDAVKINPVIGLSSVKDIRNNGLKGTRDMFVPFPGVKTPDSADGFDAPGLDFTYHDFYHAVVASYMPQGDRKLIIRIADAIDQYRKQYCRGNYDLKQIRNKFIDMENPLYWDYKDTPGNDENAIFHQTVVLVEAYYLGLQAINFRPFAIYQYSTPTFRDLVAKKAGLSLNKIYDLKQLNERRRPGQLKRWMDVVINRYHDHLAEQQKNLEKLLTY